MYTTTFKSNYKVSNGNNNISYVLKTCLLDFEGGGKLEYLGGRGGGTPNCPKLLVVQSMIDIAVYKKHSPFAPAIAIFVFY